MDELASSRRTARFDQSRHGGGAVDLWAPEKPRRGTLLGFPVVPF